MSKHHKRITVLATATMLLSLPAAASDWENVLGVYGIGASLSGAGTIRDLELDIDVDFGEILDKLEMGGMARYRGQSGKLAVVGDAVFMGLGEGGADLDLLVLEGSVGYRITKVVEGFIGLRYTDYQFDLTGRRPAGPSMTRSSASGPRGRSENAGTSRVGLTSAVSESAWI
jgi:hypothetical protein